MDTPSGYIDGIPIFDTSGMRPATFTRFSAQYNEALRLVGVTTASPLTLGFTRSTGTALAVPEAATWAMMILGMGIVGAAMRRRTQAGHSLA